MKRRISIVLIAFSVGCGSDSSEPELRKKDKLSLAEELKNRPVSFSQTPKLLYTKEDSATFEFAAEKNAVLYATYEAGNHSPHTAETIFEKATDVTKIESIKQLGVIRAKVSRLTFYNLPLNQKLKFYFFLKDIYRNETSMMRSADVKIEKNLSPASFKAQIPTAYQGRPFQFSLKATNDCLYYKLQDAPDWLSYKDYIISGVPGSLAKLGKQTFKLVGMRHKGCKADVNFSVNVLGDPLTSQSWHLDNKGQSAFAWFGAIPGLDVSMSLANELGLTGKGVHVRIAGTGMQINHPDLAENINKELNTNIEAKNPQGCAVCDPLDTTPFIEEGSVGDQGTAVAGIIAAKAWNGIGSRGIAPEATLSAINMTSIRMKPEYITLENMFLTEFDVMNQSWSKADLKSDKYEGLPVGYFDLQKIKVIQGRDGKGSVIVKAAGDDFLEKGNTALDPFNNMPWQIVVGSVSSSGVRSTRAGSGSAVWITAPGGEAGYQSDYSILKDQDYARHLFEPAILSTDLFNKKKPCTVGFAKNAAFFLERNNEKKPVQHSVGNSSGFNLGWKNNDNCAYASTINGTVAAAPMVSGAVALLLEYNPNLTWRDIKHILATTAKKVDLNFADRYTTLGDQKAIHTLGWIRNGGGYTYHNWYGFGVLDISKALKMANPKTYKLLPDLYDSDWLPVFGGGGAIAGQTPRGLEKHFTTRVKKKVETVSLKINLSTSRLAKLGLELRSPKGTRSILLPLNNGSFLGNVREFTLLSNAFYGEDMTGKWSLTALSNVNEEEATASIESWSIRFTGH